MLVMSHSSGFEGLHALASSTELLKESVARKMGRKVASEESAYSGGSNDGSRPGSPQNGGGQNKGRFTKQEKKQLFGIIREDPGLFHAFLHKKKERMYGTKSWMYEIANRYNQKATEKRSLEAIRHHLMHRKSSRNESSEPSLKQHADTCGSSDTCTKCLIYQRQCVEMGVAKCGYDQCKTCPRDLPDVADKIHTARHGPEMIKKLIITSSSSSSTTPSPFPTPSSIASSPSNLNAAHPFTPIANQAIPTFQQLDFSLYPPSLLSLLNANTSSNNSNSNISNMRISPTSQLPNPATSLLLSSNTNIFENLKRKAETEDNSPNKKQQFFNLL